MRTLMIYLAGIATAWAALALYGRIPHADRERSQRYAAEVDDARRAVEDDLHTHGFHRFTFSERGARIARHDEGSRA
jgi:hypothetical protein